MHPKKSLRDQVVVITGASSGIGRATALRAARAGASVVLTARNRVALDGVAEIIGRRAPEARTLVAPADVARRAEVEAVASEAIATFGRIDTWVNDAGVTLYGTLDETSEEDHRRLFETNFWGMVNGSLVARTHLKESGGTIINLGSILSDFALPIQGMYAASKHAVKGFTDALRMEIDAERLPISVTLIKPAAVATPLVDHVRNLTGRTAKLPPPLYAPGEVARAICAAAVHPRRDINVGGIGYMMSLAAVHAPHLADAFGAHFGPDLQLGASASSGDGNLHNAGSPAGTRGEHHGGRPSAYTRLGLMVPSLPDALGKAASSVLAGAKDVLRRG